MKEERWLPVVGWEDLYEVSDHGRVRSLPRIVYGGGFHYERPGRILRNRIDKGGRPRVSLCVDAKATDFFVHALVLTAFIGARPSETIDACHNDGDQLNNKLTNLRWDTKKSNQADRLDHGTMCFGERSPNSKLKTSQILEIIRDSRPQKVIAKEYGVVQQTISKIKQLKSWTHLHDEKLRKIYGDQD